VRPQKWKLKGHDKQRTTQIKTKAHITATIPEKRMEESRISKNRQSAWV